MSGGDAPEPQAGAEAEPAGESRQMSERTAKVIVIVIAVGAVWGLVAAFPWIAYVIVGILLAIGWQKVRDRFTPTSTEETSTVESDEYPEEPPLLTEEDVVRALHRMAAPHVFLSSLAAELDLTKEATRAVLEELHVPVRRAVRVGESTGVGVHKDDLPPLPQDPETDPVDGVDQEQPTNQQTGVRVERTDGGLRIYDLNDAHRHHRVK